MWLDTIGIETNMSTNNQFLFFFQFVNFHDAHQHRTDPDGAFALAALMEVPNQFAAMKELGYFHRKSCKKIDEEL